MSERERGEKTKSAFELRSKSSSSISIGTMLKIERESVKREDNKAQEEGEEC